MLNKFGPKQRFKMRRPRRRRRTASSHELMILIPRRIRSRPLGYQFSRANGRPRRGRLADDVRMTRPVVVPRHEGRGPVLLSSTRAAADSPTVITHEASSSAPRPGRAAPVSRAYFRVVKSVFSALLPLWMSLSDVI